MSMSRRSWASRRWLSLPLVIALSLSWALGVQASLCAPGMDSGMEMSRRAEITGGTQDAHAAHARADHCTSILSDSEESQTTCPFAINGVGPCGTTAPAPARRVVSLPESTSELAAIVSEPTAHTNPFALIQVPPPRA